METQFGKNHKCFSYIMQRITFGLPALTGWKHQLPGFLLAPTRRRLQPLLSLLALTRWKLQLSVLQAPTWRKLRLPTLQVPTWRKLRLAASHHPASLKYKLVHSLLFMFYSYFPMSLLIPYLILTRSSVLLFFVYDSEAETQTHSEDRYSARWYSEADTPQVDTS